MAELQFTYFVENRAIKASAVKLAGDRWQTSLKNSASLQTLSTSFIGVNIFNKIGQLVDEALEQKRSAP